MAESPSLVTWDALAPASKSSDGVQGASDATISHRGTPTHDFESDWKGPDFEVMPALLDRSVMIDGYVLPLVWDGRRVVEFLLVPWIGACIHTPSPPANQVIHVSYQGGLRLKKPYEPVRLAGTLQHEPAYHMLYLVDGSRPVPTSYAMIDAETAGVPGDVVAASASLVPALVRAQIRVNALFTESLSAIGRGDSASAFLLALFVAFVYGAVHTLGPGHGKAVVISYFVGTGGSLRRGLRMGVQIAIFHVLSAIIVVFLLDFGVRQVTGAPPSDYRFIRLFSYALIIAIGSVMLWQAVSSVFASRTMPHSGEHTHHDHHDHHQGCASCEAAASLAANPKGSHWIAAAVGVVPCTGALIVMLFGLANDLILPAVLMVIAISVGMAVAMSAIGVAALLARNWAERKFDTGSANRSRFTTSARLVGSACVLTIGIALFVLTAVMSPVPMGQPDGIVLGSLDGKQPEG
ncbi:MAG: DUF3299 domain-containing protein [Paracoccaceae bacterium]